MDVKEFEQALLKEKEELEKSLSSSGTKNPKDPGDWETSYPDLNVDPSDKNDIADEVEAYDTNLGINQVLEERLHAVSGALERIKMGTYGICEICGEKIELERLRANLAAQTCVKHASKL